MKNNIKLDFTKPRLNTKLNPWQITGFTDAEGGFMCSIISSSTGFKVKLEFKITQKNHSEGILHEIKNYFGCGSVVIDNRETETKKYHVTSLSNIINIIIPQFESYPCLTSKFLNFKDWKEIALIMSNREQKFKLEKIRAIHSKMNKARNFEDKYNYCKLSLGLNDNNEVCYNLPGVQAFIEGEGMLYNYIPENKNTKYLRVDSSLEIAQNSHEVAVLVAIKKFFNGGYLKPKYNISDISKCKISRSVNRFILRDTDKIIQILDKYNLFTRKTLDYEDWKQIVKLKYTGAHKTPEGLKQIIEIKEKMNSKRNT